MMFLPLMGFRLKYLKPDHGYYVLPVQFWTEIHLTEIHLTFPSPTVHCSAWSYRIGPQQLIHTLSCSISSQPSSPEGQGIPRSVPELLANNSCTHDRHIRCPHGICIGFFSHVLHLIHLYFGSKLTNSQFKSMFKLCKLELVLIDSKFMEHIIFECMRADNIETSQKRATKIKDSKFKT